MNNDLNLLVTLFQNLDEGRGSLLRCALKIPGGLNLFDQTEYMMEHAARVRELLPMHVASVGPICAIEQLFEVCAANM